MLKKILAFLNLYRGNENCGTVWETNGKSLVTNTKYKCGDNLSTCVLFYLFSSVFCIFLSVSVRFCVFWFDYLHICLFLSVSVCFCLLWYVSICFVLFQSISVLFCQFLSLSVWYYLLRTDLILAQFVTQKTNLGKTLGQGIIWIYFLASSLYQQIYISSMRYKNISAS